MIHNYQKQLYQLQEVSEIYNDSRFISHKTQNKIADFILKIVKKNKKN